MDTVPRPGEDAPPCRLTLYIDLHSGALRGSPGDTLGTPQGEPSPRSSESSLQVRPPASWERMRSLTLVLPGQVSKRGPECPSGCHRPASSHGPSGQPGSGLTRVRGCLKPSRAQEHTAPPPRGTTFLSLASLRGTGSRGRETTAPPTSNAPAARPPLALSLPQGRAPNADACSSVPLQRPLGTQESQCSAGTSQTIVGASRPPLCPAAQPLLSGHLHWTGD